MTTAVVDAMESDVEDPGYLSQQLITYLGNKRALLGPIDAAVSRVRAELDRPLVTLDAFAGSGVVSRLLKRHSSTVISNDLEPYARVLGECYLTNADEVDRPRLIALVDDLNVDAANYCGPAGFIEKLYAPEDDTHIRLGERVFYTHANARLLDRYRTLLHGFEEPERNLLLGPLLSAASVHANTAGIFKGFYKDRNTGVGRFGGTGGHALGRITRPITLTAPVFSNHRSDRLVLQHNANDLPQLLGPIDLAYLDPPYNQHPYGSNYFMLNLIAENSEPQEISRVSGIPRDWNRSGYNVRERSLSLLRSLATDIDAKFLLLSFNDEGFIAPSQLHQMLSGLGKVTEFTQRYNTFRGSRNLAGRGLHVTEHLFLVDKR